MYSIEVLRYYCISVFKLETQNHCAAGLCNCVCVCVCVLRKCVWCPSLLQVRSKVMRLQALKYSSDQMKLLPDVYHQVSASADGW